MKLSWPTRPTGGRVPHVEVVVPCHNYGRYLPGCVSSILQQRGITVAITIVDDASTDDSAQVAEVLAAAHPQIKLLRNETNLGAVGTFNRGLSQADSDYVLLLSADDLLAPGALQRAGELMEVHPNVGMVFGHAQKFSEEPHIRRPLPTTTWTMWSGQEWIRIQLRRSWSNISSPEAVVRTSVQHSVGYYDPGLPATHDVEMWLRIAAVADIGHINGVDQAFYRRHQGSHSSNFSIFRDIEERWRAYDKFLRNWSRIEDARTYRPIVQRRLSDEIIFDLLGVLEHGTVPEATIDSALALAERIDPGVASRAGWKDIEAARNDRLAGGTAALVRRGIREVAHVSGWHRWHRYRYLG